jgi:methylated-DNA-[protein]-cysteine S-methyltransferase
MHSEEFFTGLIPSPIGMLAFLSNTTALQALEFSEDLAHLVAACRRRYGHVSVGDNGDPLRVRERLEAYFAGELDALADLAVDPDGTPFQLTVWKRLLDIRPGTTTTYGAIATALGSPSSMRAVGAANGANPIALVIPCHRVIGGNGTLTGYGAGLPRKAWLLRHEGVDLPSFGHLDAVATITAETRRT